MSVVSYKTILFTVLSSVGCAACSIPSSHTVQSAHTLQQVQNIAAVPDTNTNHAVLKKAPQGCIIQFTGYFDGGESTETWQFQAQQLQQAYSQTYHYDRSRPVDALTQKHPLDLSSQVKTVFDIQTNEVKQNFEKLKSHFDQNTLQQCA